MKTNLLTRIFKTNLNFTFQPVKTYFKVLPILSLIFITNHSFAQTVPYISYPIEGIQTNPSRPGANQNRNSDLEIASNFYAIAPNAMWPASQVECFYFGTDFLAQGGSIGNNIVLGIEIKNVLDGSISFTDSISLGDTLSTGVINTILFPDCYTPSESQVDYIGTYTITSDCPDPDLSNNQQSFTYSTIDSIFSKETGATQILSPAGGNWPIGEPHSWAYGNYYYIADGDAASAKSAVFSIGNADDPAISNTLLSIFLYKWVDTNSDSNMDPDEREIVGFNNYEIIGTESPTDLINIPLSKFPSNEPGPIELESGTAYVLMLEYVTPNTQNTIFFSTSDEFDYSAQVAFSIEVGTPRYAQMLGIGGDLSVESYSSVGFGRHIAPVARLVLTSTLSNLSNELVSSDDQLFLSPNPSSGILNIEIPKMNTAKQGTLLVYDLLGRLIQEKKIDFNSGQNTQIDVSHYTNGVYFVVFKTNGTAISAPFNVKK